MNTLKELEENISQVEYDSLKKVFQNLDSRKDGRLDTQEILDAVLRLGYRSTLREIELMIWEVDDDLDQHVSWEEFLVMYQRCISDRTGLEPRGLFNLVQFLMYDKDNLGSISVEQTLQILFVRYGREKLDAEIQEIFGDDGDKQSGRTAADGQEKRITFSEYLQRVNARLKKTRSAKPEVTKVQIITKEQAAAAKKKTLSKLFT
ncbi:unnamed protein product [Amoebophrya sp. A120]|nr:unnamed protein product [Amoebophrya sp. A120]|eukprot:GSA120T00021021001.1